MLGFYPMSAAPVSSLGLAMSLAATVGSYAVTGQPANTHISRTSEAGAYAVTGQDAELDPSLFFRCQTGDFTTTGQVARFGRSVVSGAGAYQTVGQPATFALGQVLEADPGAYTSTGQPIVFVIGASVIGEAGAYALTGQNLAARYVLRGDPAVLGSASPQWPMASQPMSSLGPVQPSLVGYALQGAPVTFKITGRSAAGAYHLTGYPVRFVRGPIYRVRGRDLSGPYVIVRDFSEGLP